MQDNPKNKKSILIAIAILIILSLVLLFVFSGISNQEGDQKNIEDQLDNEENALFDSKILEENDEISLGELI